MRSASGPLMALKVPGMLRMVSRISASNFDLAVCCAILGELDIELDRRDRDDVVAALGPADAVADRFDAGMFSSRSWAVSDSSVVVLSEVPGAVVMAMTAVGSRNGGRKVPPILV